MILAAGDLDAADVDVSAAAAAGATTDLRFELFFLSPRSSDGPGVWSTGCVRLQQKV
jgi:hypothetical protein